MAFNLYNLAKNPEKQQILYEEIMNTAPVGQPLNGKIVDRMPYLKAVIKETHR